MTDLTRILAQIESGDRQAADELLPVVYDELRALAEARLAQERSGHTLQPTALVHEAWLRLAGNEADEPKWDSRGHFFGAAARAMRRILVDHARQKQSLKRGGDVARVDVDVDQLEGCAPDDELLALDEALEEFAQVNPEKAELVQLRYFGGLTNEQAAACLGVSVSTAERYWTYARAWLHQAMAEV
jgi:RNA polymerase sigma factor (TIGR02999 family)